MRVGSLHRYPIKSMLGETVTELFVAGDPVRLD